VDLSCDPLEATLVPWTLSTLSARMADPAVRAAVAALGGAKALGGGSVDARVARYAADLLADR
jgi:hypothetical protein